MMWPIFLLCVIPLIVLLVVRLYVTRQKDRKNVCVLVLGDVGRSPRMQYHAISFAKEGFTVDLIGYPGSTPLKDIRDNPLIKIHYLQPLPNLENKLPRMLCYAVKTIWQAVTLLRVLFWKRISNHVIMQNPPAIPTIPICWFYCVIMGSYFTIDWHNYAHTLMALSLKEGHFLVKLAKFIETYFGVRAHNSFCVTKAMKKDLEEKWGIKAEVLYDRPADEFHPISLSEKHEFLLRLSKEYPVFKGATEDSTVFTECVSDEIQLLSKRPGFIVSSTSWTEDEDFSVLLNALQEYENAVENGDSNLPDLICAITGKGPLKDFYMAIIELKKWNHITIITPWLENEDYPKILASADLGICLHTSSSGVDLPMKVVDMFGCGLPVCAFNFKCLPELVRHNENSLIFSNDKELAAQLILWFENFPNSEEQQKLDKMFRQELNKFQENRWHGILTQEISYNLNRLYPGMYHSYIAASYVKFIEGAGGRVVPIWIGKDESYYEDIMSKINGILWPGGATFFNQSHGYADAGYTIYKIAKRLNQNGDYFPIFGICLGFELLTYVAADRVEHRTDCNSINQPLPLEFKRGFRRSKMFEDAPDNIITILQTKNVTANYHRYCVTEEDLKEVSLEDQFRIMSFNYDVNGLKFISSLEHVTMPFYGLQFHPEKNLYEWILGKKIPHSSRAVASSQYFANFFVNEARRSMHHFDDADEEAHSLIYNYPVTYTGLKRSSFVQAYMFTENGTGGNNNPRKRTPRH